MYIFLDMEMTQRIYFCTERFGDHDLYFLSAEIISKNIDYYH